MSVGKIITLPNAYSDYGTVEGEYGTRYTVKKEEFKASSKEGGEFPYRITIWEGEDRPGTTLVYDKNGRLT